jgi:AhpD family alkylhydroperoxidase
MIHAGAHACTDVTGFGLLGHLYQMTRESGVTAEISWDRVPLLPEVLDHARAGMVSGAAERNREFASPVVTAADGVPDYALDLLYDPQTSGGLLFAVPTEAANGALAELKAAGCHKAAIVGRITQPSDGRIIVTGRPESAAQPCCPPEAGDTVSAAQPCCPEVAADAEDTASCCPDAQGSPAGPASAQQAFQQFMSAAFAPGALDVVQKELTTIALSVAVQCDACLTAHLSKALSMGVTPQEIQEAAWLGVVFGGCKAMMFWRQHERSLETNEAPRASNTVKA